MQGRRSLREADFVYEDQLANHHTNPRCEAVTGAMLEFGSARSAERRLELEARLCWLVQA